MRKSTKFSLDHTPFHRIQQQNSQMPVFLPKDAYSSPVGTTKKTKWKVKRVISGRISSHFQQKLQQLNNVHMSITI